MYNRLKRWNFNVFAFKKLKKETLGYVFRERRPEPLKTLGLRRQKKLKNMHYFFVKVLAFLTALVYTKKACVRR